MARLQFFCFYQTDEGKTRVEGDRSDYVIVSQLESSGDGEEMYLKLSCVLSVCAKRQQERGFNARKDEE